MLEPPRVRKRHPRGRRLPSDATTDPSLRLAGRPDDADGPGGVITIGDDVVAQVVGLTVLECYGVVGMASKRRFVATMECERLWPKAGRLPQE